MCVPLYLLTIPNTKRHPINTKTANFPIGVGVIGSLQGRTITSTTVKRVAHAVPALLLLACTLQHILAEEWGRRGPFPCDAVDEGRFA